MKIYEGKNVPIKSWCNNPEEGALAQARDLTSLPFIFKHVSVMPDTHQGYGMPIGGVAATEVAAGGIISPGMIGYDTNCGMRLVSTNLRHDDVKGALDKIISYLFSAVPSGVGSAGKISFNKSWLYS